MVNIEGLEAVCESQLIDHDFIYLGSVFLIERILLFGLQPYECFLFVQGLFFVL